jgi:hypothetical protein
MDTVISTAGHRAIEMLLFAQHYEPAAEQPSEGHL